MAVDKERLIGVTLMGHNAARMVSTETANKELVRRFFDQVWNQGRVELVEQFAAADYASHNKLGIEVLGPEGLRQVVIAQRSAFPDLVTQIDDLIAESDKVVVRAIDRGTFLNPFMGILPTGNRFAITWIDIFRIEDGALKEAWLEIDSADFRSQLLGNR